MHSHNQEYFIGESRFIQSFAGLWEEGLHIGNDRLLEILGSMFLDVMVDVRWIEKVITS